MADQLTHELVLRGVGVLVLVDHDVPETPVVVLGDVGEGLKDVDRRHDQVVEVQRIGLTQTPLVHPVGLGHHALVMAGLAEPGRVGLLVDQLVLEVGHLRGEGPRPIALGVQVEVAQDHRHEALAVGGVIDREGRLQPDVGGLATQDAHTGRVECRDPHGLAAGADQRGNPIAHLAGGLVGEGDREDLTGPDIARRQQVGDPVRQHAGLARARPGDDQQRRPLVDDRGPLLGVEPLEQRLRVATDHRAGMPTNACPAGGSPPASAQVGTPRSSTSPLAAAGLSPGRGKSPKSVLIVSSSLRPGRRQQCARPVRSRMGLGRRGARGGGARGGWAEAGREPWPSRALARPGA